MKKDATQRLARSEKKSEATPVKATSGAPPNSHGENVGRCVAGCISKCILLSNFTDDRFAVAFYVMPLSAKSDM
jgi:hypothetical protein